jgi:predicted PP-loop superfamily ATPase
MESSASEDEKILRDQEELEQLTRKEEAAASNLERIRRAIKLVKERIERKSAMPERFNQSKRQAIHVSSIASGTSDATAVGGNDSGMYACQRKFSFALDRILTVS